MTIYDEIREWFQNNPDTIEDICKEYGIEHSPTPAWNKGMPWPDYVKKHMKKSAKKRANTEEGLKHLRSVASLGSINRNNFKQKEETKREHSKRMKSLWKSGVYSEERNQKISAAHTGKKWYNNGAIEYRYFPDDVPDGYTKGRLKKC